MNYKLISLILSYAVPITLLVGCSTSRTTYNFSNLKWNDSIDKVKAKLVDINFNLKDVSEISGSKPIFSTWNGTIFDYPVELGAYFGSDHKLNAVIISGYNFPNTSYKNFTSNSWPIQKENVWRELTPMCQKFYEQLVEKYGNPRFNSGGFFNKKLLKKFLHWMREADSISSSLNGLRSRNLHI